MKNTLALLAVIALTFSYAPLVHANSCTLNAPTTISFPPSGSANIGVTCDVDTCDVTTSSLPSGDVTVAPSSFAVGTTEKIFTVSSILTSGSASLVVAWACPSPTGDLEDSRTVIIDTPVTIATAAETISAGSDGDPVSTFNGELYNQYPTDISLGGPFPLTFFRYYASGLETSNALVGRWRHNYEWSGNFTSASKKVITTPWGRTLTFVGTSATSTSAAAFSLSGKTDIAFQFHQAVQFGPYTLFDPRDQLIYEFKFSGDPRLISIRDGKGNVHTLNYVDSFSKTITSVSDGLGRALNFTYTNFGLDLISVDDGQGRSVSFSYIPNPTGFGKLLDTVTDTRGMVTSYAYEIDNLMTSLTRPAGNTPFSQTWNASNQVASQTDANTNTTTFTYAASLTTITDPMGETRIHTHTATGELANSQDTAAQNVVIGSDADGRRNSITDRFGDITTMTYHAPSGNLASRTNADATTESFSYAVRTASTGLTAYDLSGITHADTTTESFTYDVNGNLTLHTDQAGEITSATYNGNGQPQTITNVAGGVTTDTYNVSDATLDTTTSPAGNTTTYGYDVLKRMNLVTFDDSNTRSMTYDDADNLLTVTDENNNTRTLTYDDNGNLSSSQDPLLSTSSFTYDENDRLLSVTDPFLGVTSRTFDQLNRVATKTNPNGNVTTLGYDIHNRLTSITDPLLNVWSSTYDVEGVIASRTDPLLNTTSFVSDKMGRITKVTSPMGNISSVTYDSMGRINTRTDELNNVTTLTLDARGLFSNASLFGGTISASYIRNAFGEITTITDPNSNNWLLGYDNMGRTTSSTDPLANVQTISYDNRNRPATVTFPGALGSLSLGFDPAGNLTSNSYSDGTTFNLVYDANDHLISADGLTLTHDANDRIIDSNGIITVRDVGERITSMMLATGKSVVYAYDANDNLVSVTDWVGGVTTFSYDDAGKLIGITRPNGINATISYDNDSRLTDLTEGASSISLTRDAKGQITNAVRSVPQSASSYGLSSATRSVDAASQLTSATYDELGRTTSEGSNSYSWNLASHLTSMSTASGTTTATYDAMGNRLSRTTAGSTRSYSWNYAFGLPSISIEQQDGSDLRYYVHTPGGALLYSVDAVTNARNFYHYDEMGNTLFVTNDAGSEIGSYAYSPYGQLIAETGALDNPFTWQGQYGIMDEADGLYYIRARYYDANTGRFISRDPVRSVHPMKINPYQYSMNNPLLFIDVSGRDPVKIPDPVKFIDIAGSEPGKFHDFEGTSIALKRTYGDVKEILQLIPWNTGGLGGIPWSGHEGKIIKLRLARERRLYDIRRMLDRRYIDGVRKENIRQKRSDVRVKEIESKEKRESAQERQQSLDLGDWMERESSAKFLPDTRVYESNKWDLVIEKLRRKTREYDRRRWEEEREDADRMWERRKKWAWRKK